MIVTAEKEKNFFFQPLSPREAAAEVLENFYLDADGKASFPVDSVKISARMGVQVFRAKLEPTISAVVVSSGDGSAPRINLNKRNSQKLNRYLSALELGRVVLSSGKKFGAVELFDSFNRDAETAQANSFARELLMPASAVRQFSAEGFTVKKLARIFGVNKQTLTGRLLELGLY